MLLRRAFVLVMTSVLAFMLWGCQDNTEPQKALPKDTVTVDIDTPDIYHVGRNILIQKAP